LGYESGVADQSIVRFREVFEVAYARLEERREEINDLNVFPVADGDTGDNMTLTMRAVLDELHRLEAENGDPDRIEIVEAVAHAAMMGARGNSGVILSQIVRGAAEELASRPGQLIDPRLVSAALSNAAAVARDSVPNPAPGTMLTAIAAMGEEVSKRLAHWESHSLEPEASPMQQNLLLAEMLQTAVGAGTEAVERSTEQLSQLREAGVVDAGALGLVVIVRGAIEGLVGSGEALPEIPHYEAARIERAHEQGSKYRYCTNFVVRAPDLVARDWIAELEGIGDSVLAVADRTALKVHVHTDDPQAAVAIFDGVGPVEMQEQTDMREQIAARASANAVAGTAAVSASRTGVVAVVAGDGIAAMLSAEGVMIVDGGPTLNPSTEEILAAIESHPAPEVVVLPNSKNVVLAAERAAELASKEALVVSCLSQQAAVMLAVEFEPDAAAGDNAARLERVLAEIRTGSVAPAARDDAEGRFAEGDAVGFVGEEPVAWGDAAAALHEVASRLAEGAEVLAILTGEGAPALGDDLGFELDAVELEIRDGGQPAYWWLLAAQ
jgi:hypothetical protein